MDLKYILSACLAGDICRFDAKAKRNDKLIDILNESGCKYIFACPEVLGGLAVPRTKAQIKKGGGNDVLNGDGRVVDETGRDVTGEFISGAKAFLRIAEDFGVKSAVLNDKSPSCGVNYIYNNDKLVKGCGVLTALLIETGFKVISDKDFIRDNG